MLRIWIKLSKGPLLAVSIIILTEFLILLSFLSFKLYKTYKSGNCKVLRTHVLYLVSALIYSITRMILILYVIFDDTIYNLVLLKAMGDVIYFFAVSLQTM